VIPLIVFVSLVLLSLHRLLTLTTDERCVWFRPRIQSAIWTGIFRLAGRFLFAAGTVKFGLSYKYQGTVPTSDRQFTMNFNNANLLFNATTISSLVISNSMATLTGTGTINGSGSYNFLVTGVNGGDIRIQITDPSNNNNVIYDTQPGAAAIATPTTSVTGNVIAHN
jgi:hypothetical protein